VQQWEKHRHERKSGLMLFSEIAKNDLLDAGNDRECKKLCVNGFSLFKFGKTIAGSYSPEG